MKELVNQKNESCQAAMFAESNSTLNNTGKFTIYYNLYKNYPVSKNIHLNDFKDKKPLSIILIE